MKDSCRKSDLEPGQDSRAQRQGPALLGTKAFLCTALNSVLTGFRNSETSCHCCPLYRAARHLLTRGFLFHLQLCPEPCKSAPTKFCVSSLTSPQGFLILSAKIPWRMKWQLAPVFLPGESHEPRSLASYCPRGCKELDSNERLSNHACSS